MKKTQPPRSPQRRRFWTDDCPGVRANIRYPYRHKKSTERFREVLDLYTVIGRRNWTRTNDPHHVKVVL